MKIVGTAIYAVNFTDIFHDIYTKGL